jgi:hypothetical protein
MKKSRLASRRFSRRAGVKQTIAKEDFTTTF